MIFCWFNPTESCAFLTGHDSVAANGQWNPWGPWSGCSKSCDGGWQRRVRVCQGAAVTGHQCDGNGEEVRKCSDQRCPGEPGENKAPHRECKWKRRDNYPCGGKSVSRCTRPVKT